MNFDVPYIQDLASTKRLPHSIGTCFLAYKTVEKTALSLETKKKIVTAALIHDIGILPFGHLLESTIKKKNPGFSHEKLVYSILTGTYHPTNIYHQILGTESLRLNKVLRQNSISPNEIFALICPDRKHPTAISADIDLDNIDNVHRMANLLGYDKAKANLHSLACQITIDKKNRLVFENNAIENISEWLKMRQSIYTMIIGHPECVSYNAFLGKLLKTAVDAEIVNEDNWFITDNKFESMLVESKVTHQLATWLYTRQHYELVDYIWFLSNDMPIKDLYEIESLIEQSKFEKPNKSSFYFFWTDKKLISREVSVNLNNNSTQTIGINSYSLLVSLINKSEYRSHMLRTSESSKIKWRKDIYNYTKELLPEWNFTMKFPSDYNDNFFNSKIEHEQLSLFK
jgi:HD superfamily phosphohydrolase